VEPAKNQEYIAVVVPKFLLIRALFYAYSLQVCNERSCGRLSLELRLT